METISEVQSQLKNELQNSELNLDKVSQLYDKLIKLDPKYQRFTVDAKTLIHLGRDSIKDHSTALIELVKNSYDADALNVEVEIFSKTKDLIRIADNGFGMTKEELKNNWLRVGFSSKRKSRESDLGRRKTGEKGIGRISTDRLGSLLEIRTKSKNDELTGLRLNWDDFDVENKSVSDIKVEIFTPAEITIPSRKGRPAETGTEILISNQRQPWSKENISNLYQELSSLTPPFENTVDFEIELRNDIDLKSSGKIDSNFLKAAEIEIEAYYDGKGTEVIYTYRDKYKKSETIQKIDLNNLFSNFNIEYDNESNKLKTGPIILKLYFFLRESASVKDVDFNIKSLREFLDNNAGIKIYRDRIAVKPYGFPKSQFGYDWLELADRKAQDPAGLSRASQSKASKYRVTPNQLVGAVFIKRDDNIALSDSAAREGLVESEAFYDLKKFVLGSINMLESYRTKLLPEISENRKKNQQSTETVTEKVIKALSNIEGDLDKLNEQIQDNTGIDPVVKVRLKSNIESLNKTTEKVDRTISDLLAWNRTLSGLATIGISSAVFGHETEGSISQFKASLKAVDICLSKKEPDLVNAKKEIAKAQKHSKKVAAWGAYALTRVQREKRKKKIISIKSTIESVISELLPAFKASSIEINFESEQVVSFTYQMDIETILINLLTNSYTATTQKAGNRIINIKLEYDYKKISKKETVKGFIISVSDSGPGISNEFIHRIFEPLFSTKVNPSGNSNSIGTGLGLTVVNSITRDLKGDVNFDHDPELRGARFKVWLPIEKKDENA